MALAGITDAKYYVYGKSVALYHSLLFFSFVGAINLYPYAKEQVIQRFTHQYIQLGLPYLITYLAAVYIIPEIFFYVIKMSMEDK